jgi:hypothetical protein
MHQQSYNEFSNSNKVK